MYIISLFMVDMASNDNLYHLPFSSLMPLCLSWMFHASLPVSAISMKNASFSFNELTAYPMTLAVSLT